MFKNVTGKMGNMRKVMEWSVYPTDSSQPNQRIIQCPNRIASVDLVTGKAKLSNGKGGHQGFHKLASIMGATNVDCPEDILSQLKAFEA